MDLAPVPPGTRPSPGRSLHRQAIAALGSLVALGVAACGPVAPTDSRDPSIPVRTPAATGAGVPSPLDTAGGGVWSIRLRNDPAEAELTVLDRVGLVIGLAETNAPLDGTGRGLAVANPDGDTSKLVVGWTSTICDKQPRITLEAAGDAVVLAFDPGPGSERDCDAAGYGWRAEIALAASVPAANVVTRAADNDAVVWNLASSGRDGRRVVVIDRTRKVTAAAAAQPRPAEPNVVTLANGLFDDRVLGLGWLADECFESTEVSLTPRGGPEEGPPVLEAGDRLKVEIRLMNVEEGSCRGVRTPHAVSLTFAVPVPADLVDAVVLHSGG